MEDKLLSGDYIFVSKVAYGPRLPQTWLSVPFAHDSLSWLGRRSYSSHWQFPYRRLASASPQVNDLVLFNIPVDKSLNIPTDRRPIEISRCVGMPGDIVSWSAVANEVKINGRILVNRPTTKSVYSYRATSHPAVIKVVKELNISSFHTSRSTSGETAYCLLNNLDYYRMSQDPRLKSVLHKYVAPNGMDTTEVHLLPYKGFTLSAETFDKEYLYNLICQYEPVEASCRGGKLYIDGKEVDTYRFCYDYYWVLSDNRELARDSRSLGAIPETHLIGKAVFIWCSVDKDQPLSHFFRWNRFFQRL